MTVAPLLAELEAAQIKLRVLEGNLKLEGPTAAISPELVARIKPLKASLIEFLNRRAQAFTLTPLQRAYYRGRSTLFDSGGIANQVYHEIEGFWDIDRLQLALVRVVQQHSALRLSLFSDDEQAECAPLPQIIRHDLRNMRPVEQQHWRDKMREENSHQVLPTVGPLLKVEVAVLADDKMVMYVNHDGMVVDGISMFLLFSQWQQHYQQYDQPETEPQQFMPFSEHISALVHERQLPPYLRAKDYWMQRIASLPKAPELPMPHILANESPRFSQRVLRLSTQEWQQLQACARAYQVTPAAALMAAYAETLYVWGAGEHFTLNTTVSNRKPIHPQAFSSIGPFSDLLLVEIILDHQQTFAQRASAVQVRLHHDIDHRYFSGIEVMQELARQRGGPAAAKMPYTFNCTLGAMGGIDGSALEGMGHEVYTLSQTPQVYLDAFIFEQYGELVIRLDGVDKRFYPGFLDALAAGLQRLLLQLCQPENWQQLTFNLLPEDQEERRRASNNTMEPRQDEMLGDAFISRAMQQPTAPAVITLGLQMSYSELLNRASVAAQWLIDQGAKRNELIALVAVRGPEHIVGIMAIVLAGAAYLPIDAALPVERRNYMLRDGGVRYVMTNIDLSLTLPTFDLRHFAQDLNVVIPPRDPQCSADDLAYVLYTSGTTGDPKGVMVTHRNVANVVADCQQRFRLTPHDRLFAISAFNFDLSVWDVFGALSAGAALVIPDADKSTDIEHWTALCQHGQVSVWNSVPAIVRMMYDFAGQMPTTLRLIMMSGDRIPPDLPAALMKTQPSIQLVSLGGPTETTIWNISHFIEALDCQNEFIPYGKPNANNRAYVRNPQGVSCPDWVAGEIYAAGTGITVGYWGDAARTTEKYSFDAELQERMFRTGDLGRYLPNGDIDILGRVDLQIKINGYRIEAGEIESLMAQLPEIKQIAVVAGHTEQGDILIAHAVAQTHEHLSIADIRRHLGSRLPEYMIPARVVWHTRLPMSNNQKIDRRALVMMVLEQSATSPPAEAHFLVDDSIEKSLQKIWARVLGKEEIAPEQDFFALGGTSMSAVRILTSVRKEFGVAMPLESIYRFNTVRAMASNIAALQENV